MSGLITSVAIVDAPGTLRTAVARGLWREGRMTVTLFDDATAFAGTAERPVDIALVAIELVDAITTLSPLRRAARSTAWWRGGATPTRRSRSSRSGAARAACSTSAPRWPA
jgi:hypothetical protein